MHLPAQAMEERRGRRRIEHLKIVVGVHLQERVEPPGPVGRLVQAPCGSRSAVAVVGGSLAIISKQHPGPDATETLDMVGDVEGKIAIIVDDMISTGGTLVEAAEMLKSRGARSIQVAATHGIAASDWATAQEGWGKRIQEDRALGTKFNSLYAQA